MFRCQLLAPTRRSVPSLAALASTLIMAPRLTVFVPVAGRLLLALALLLGAAGTADAQRGVYADRMPEERSGPRFGVTYLGGAIPDTAAARGMEVSRVITQFGWQIERQFLAFDGGPTAVSEWILLVGGLEQGAFIPSISWIVGVRLPNNVEFGVGPNVAAGGTALVLTAGRTYTAGALNVPVNVAVVPSKIGTRLSVMTGFNMHR